MDKIKCEKIKCEMCHRGMRSFTARKDYCGRKLHLKCWKVEQNDLRIIECLKEIQNEIQNEISDASGALK